VELIGRAGLPAVPLVTVVIPCYNQGHFLAEAIQGALDQTHPRVEIVVVDDGSTDTTPIVASAYQGIRYVHQENRGLAGARNRGLKESAGECLVFLDSDDRLHPCAVEVGLRCLQRWPAAAFAYGRCNLIGADGAWLATSERPIVEGDHYRVLLCGNFLPNPAAMIFRRASLEAVGGFSVNSNGKGAEDYELCLRLTREYEARGHKEVIADYRQHEASMSRSPRPMSESVLYALQSQREYVSRNPTYIRAWRKGMRNWRRRYHAAVLISRVRDSGRAGHWGLVIRDTVALLLANPWLLFENAGRKIKALSRSPRARGR
jgi:glycosyltransferase involved in cell wall biosynthesis